jgi:hypothetical protein
MHLNIQDIIGCKKQHNKLHILITLLQIKASNSWSDKGLNGLFNFLGTCFQKIMCCPKACTKLRILFVH